MSRIACHLIHALGDGTYRDEAGRIRPMLDAPVGSLWYCDWWPMGERGPDGRFLVIMTAAGTWCPDRFDGTRYTRTGNVPVVTVKPDFARETADGMVRATLVDGVLETSQ